MNDHSTEFATLLDEISRGSEEATRNFIDLYGPHVQRAVRRRLNVRMRSRFDSHDFMQAVWASFFARLPDLRDVLERPSSIIRFLARMASNKVVDEYRRCFESEKNNVLREQRITDDLSPSGRHRPPRPSEFAIAHEQWARLVEGQPEHYQQILTLRVAGETHKEIARRLNVSERTVRRVIKKLAERLA